jgi:Holliday junction resolvase RusA-like endonuclease
MRILLLGVYPLSANDMYRSVTRPCGKGKYRAMTISTDELIAYKQEIKNAISSSIKDLNQIERDESAMYRLKIEASYPREKFFFGNGKYRKMDASNIIKALEDSISEAINVDDKHNQTVEVSKFYNDEGHVIIYVELEKLKDLSVIHRGLDYYKERVLEYNSKRTQETSEKVEEA